MRIRLGLTAVVFLCVAILPNVCISDQRDPASLPAKMETGTVTGKVMIRDGGPLAGGRVFFYDTSTGPPPFKERFKRLPDISGEIGADGKFTVELPAGKYYMRAGRRNSEGGGGLSDGDFVLFSMDEKGRPNEYVIKGGAILDIGTISGAVPYEKVGQDIKTAIEGVITDMEGRPVAGATVFAFIDQTTTRKPLYFSERTGNDGKYILRVPGGTYYLRVRNKLGGGPPEPGQILGIFGEQVPTAIMVKDGEIKRGIDIKVIRFRGRGPASGTGPGVGRPKQQ